MDNFIEPRVVLNSKSDIKLLQQLVEKINVKGYAIIGSKINKKNLKNLLSIEFPLEISRIELTDNNLKDIRKKLAVERYKCELLSVYTSKAKIAQWVVKDNRVDILSVSTENMKEIITKELANVASANRTFIELDIGSFLADNRKSIKLRTFYRISHLLLKRKVPIILTFNVNNPYLIRDKRTALAFGEIIGIPHEYLKKCFRELYDRVLLNRKKLQDNFVAPGIWKVRSDKKNEKNNIKVKVEERPFFPFDSNQLVEQKLKFERQRYLLFEIIAEKEIKIEKRDLEKSLWDHFNELFGVVGSSRVGLYLTHFNSERNIGILRCNHKYLNLTRFVLGSITNYKEIKLLIHITKVSGTLRKFIQKIQ